MSSLRVGAALLLLLLLGSVTPPRAAAGVAGQVSVLRSPAAAADALAPATARNPSLAGTSRTAARRVSARPNGGVHLVPGPARRLCLAFTIGGGSTAGCASFGPVVEPRGLFFTDGRDRSWLAVLVPDRWTRADFKPLGREQRPVAIRRSAVVLRLPPAGGTLVLSGAAGVAPRIVEASDPSSRFLMEGTDDGGEFVLGSG